jgi:hypothetical protein
MWFLKAVAKWLDIALFKAVRRILKAVDLVSVHVELNYKRPQGGQGGSVAPWISKKHKKTES